MKKFILSVCILLLAISINAQTISVTPLNIGQKHILNSKILNEKRTLNIYLPYNYDKAKAYPVIYLLDGSLNQDFLHIAGMVQFFNQQFKMPDFIVIGIANVDRKRDFTFHTDLKDLQKEYPTTGSSAKFINFIEKELQPYIQSTFKTTETKYIIGQSLAGLLASEILIKKPQLFSHYLIISPSLWWDNESLLKLAKTDLNTEKLKGKYVYLSVGENEHPVMVKDANDFNEILMNKLGSLKLNFAPMPNENHATILHQSIYKAFNLLFPFKE